VPQVPYFHHVRDAACRDEESKESKHPTEGQITPFADEPNDGKRNRKVGGRNQRIGYDVQPHQSRIPLVAVTVRLKPPGREPQTKKVHCTLQPEHAEDASNPLKLFRRKTREFAHAFGPKLN
jgi:hypothetical protein